SGPHAVVKFLGHARAPLPHPVVANNILRVDGEWDELVERSQALSIRSHQRPTLAGKDRKAILHVNLSPQLPLTKVKAGTFQFVRGRGGTEEVGFIISTRFPSVDLS